MHSCRVETEGPQLAVVAIGAMSSNGTTWWVAGGSSGNSCAMATLPKMVVPNLHVGHVVVRPQWHGGGHQVALWLCKYFIKKLPKNQQSFNKK